MIELRINGSHKPPIDEVGVISFGIMTIIAIIVLING